MTATAAKPKFIPPPRDRSAHERVLAHLAEHGHAGNSALIGALRLNATKLNEVLTDLMEAGQVCAHSGGYALITFDYDREAVRQDKAAAILDYLMGRRDTAHGVAQALRLNLETARATCEMLREGGELSAKCVGNLLLYTPA